MKARHPLIVNDTTVIPPPTQTAERAMALYEPAFRRVIEYVTIADVPGDVLEFGCFHGYTARTLAELMAEYRNKNSLYLYDSWEGFPAMEGNDAKCPEVSELKTWKQGDCRPVFQETDKLIGYALNLVLPERVFTTKGFYSDTLPAALPKKASVVHVDCDLYESTRTVLENILKEGPLSQGSVILFDEYNSNFASNEYGQRRVLRDLFPIYSHMQWISNDGKTKLEPWFNYGSSGYAFIVHRNP